MTKEIPQKQRRELKARAHHLKPVVMIGDAGLTDAVLAEAEIAIAHHELIKIRLPGMEREARQAMQEKLCKALQAALIQRLGHTVTLYRKRPDED